MTVPAGERRVVSVLVADVAGSTAIAEQLGPERSKYLFDEVVGVMREEVERLEGTVAQLTGDGVLALFGAPVAHEDDSERAVRAALGIQDALARYGDEVGPAYGIDLRVRVAVNTGPVVVPGGDAPADVLYNALGDTVNVAARLQAEASDVTVALGPGTARQVAAHFELESLGELELKGKAEPVEAFRVVAEAAPKGAVAVPLVGREAELAHLEEILEELLDGRGAIATITGEAGIGKSRLKSEARDRYRDRVRFLEGHAASYAGDIPYWPLRELLRDWLGLGLSEPEARVRLELKASLGRVLGEEADDAYPFLASAVGLSLERDTGERLRDLSRDSVQQQTFDSFSRLICALAREQPLALVLEDLQWADEATLALLDEVFLLTEEEAVLLVLSYRSEHDHSALDLAERARRRYRHRFSELELAPLRTADAASLAASAAGAELPEAVATVLAERSGGNPFFLEEALRDLVERGVLRRRNGRLEPADGGALAVPALVQEALQARLDRLEDATRAVVSVAAVIGRSFGLPLLEQLVPREQLRPALSELQRLDLVVEERRRPTPEYRFRHGLVQEVAYGGLVETRRRELHREVGEALEQLHKDTPEEVCGLLARHFSEANEAVRAVEYLLEAGDAARALYAEDEALDLYRRALAFLERAGEEEQARETLLKVALTHHFAFEFEQAADAYAEAFSRPAPEPHRLEPRERIVAFGPTTFDRPPAPGHALVEGEWELLRHLYRGLVRIGPDFEIAPDIAESFSVSADGRAYRFQLRDDARWSDGAPVTADDFAFSWQQIETDNLACAFLLDDVDSATALDRTTLEICLREPRNYFLHLLGQPPFFAWPRHLYERLGPRWYESLPLVANGPFELRAVDERHALLAASPTWHGARGNVLEIELLRWRSVEEAFDSLRTGRADAIPLVLFGTAWELEDTIVDSKPGMSTAYLGFCADRPPLDDGRVRRALAHGIDRRRFSRAQGFSGDPANAGGLVPPTMPGHSHRVAPVYDLAVARRLLEEAGYPSGRGIGTLTIGYPQEWRPDQASELAAQLQELGIGVERSPFPMAEFGSFIDAGAHVWIWAYGADYLDPRGILESLLAYAPHLYRDAEIDALLERARSLQDRDERLRTYREFERLWIGEHVALVPLVYSRRLAYRRSRIQNVWMNALATSTFAEAVVQPELQP